MSTIASYFDHSSIEETAHALSSIHTACRAHAGSKDAYSSPAFTEWKKRAITVDDMPMGSSTNQFEHPVREDQHLVPWEDSIKNFIFDATSLDTSSKFNTCILLSEHEYKYQEATIHMIAGKYGRENSCLIDIMPHRFNNIGECTEFSLKLRYKDADGLDAVYESLIDASTLTSTIVQWYIPSNTVVFCHDSSIQQYQDIMLMMPESTWSLQCTSTNYILNASNTKCHYVCPNFACNGSVETRAVSNGQAVFTNANIPSDHRSKLDYYSRCIRPSKHFSGKCYDCKKLELAVNNIYKSPLSTPTVSKFASFSPTFINSSKRFSNSYSDSGYGSTKSFTK